MERSIFEGRRRQLLAQMADRSVAIISGATETRRNADVHHRFRQHSDLLYLSGFPEPEALAVISKVPSKEPGKESKAFTLFCRPRDKEQETWTGRRTGLEGAINTYGADQAFAIADLKSKLPSLLDGCNEVYLHPGDNPKLDSLVLSTIAGLRKRERQGARAPRRITDIQTVLHEQRLIKDDFALTQMRKAVAITTEAHQAAMKAARDGAHEYEIEALIDYTFRRRGGHPGYGTIVGGGRNATILHYVNCDDVLRGGELLLVDAGCEYGGYTADVTRTYPIADREGKVRFTEVQRRVYDVVLRAQLAGIALAVPGATVEDIHKCCTQVLTEGMVELGLLIGDPKTLIEKEEHKKYYMHRTSHWLGLDVHDVGDYTPGGKPRTFQKGMVLTIEPGLYIGEDAPDHLQEYRGIGVRIEDDILITETGQEVLTAAIPKDPQDLLALLSG